MQGGGWVLDLLPGGCGCVSMSGSMAGRVWGWQSSVELWSVAGVNRAGGGS